jgi:hypothetical protein
VPMIGERLTDKRLPVNAPCPAGSCR